MTLEQWLLDNLGRIEIVPTVGQSRFRALLYRSVSGGDRLIAHATAATVSEALAALEKLQPYETYPAFSGVRVYNYAEDQEVSG